MVKEWLTCIALGWLTFGSKREIDLIRSSDVPKRDALSLLFGPAPESFTRFGTQHYFHRTRMRSAGQPRASLEKANRTAKARSGTIKRAAARQADG